MEVVVETLDGLPLIEKGDNIGDIINSRVELNDVDVVAVASTIVSKSEGRKKHLSEFVPNERAVEIAKSIGEDKDPRFAQAVLEESEELVMEKPFLLAATKFGHVAPNAGIDRSNVEGDGNILLLPRNPSRSARRISEKIGCPVVVTDTCGRPFRMGQTGVAVGWSGFNPVKTWKGREDLHGRELEVTVEAVADEISAFANFSMGEGDEGTPVVIFRDIERRIPTEGNKKLFRPKETDLVREALQEWRDGRKE